MGEGGRLDSPVLDRACPLSACLSVSLPPCRVSPLHLDCRRARHGTTEQCTNLHSLCAVVASTKPSGKLSHIINLSLCEYPPEQSRPARCAVAKLGHDATGGFTFCTWLRSCSKGGAAAFPCRENWITRFLWFAQGGAPFPFRASRKPDRSSASLNHDATSSPFLSPHSALLLLPSAKEENRDTPSDKSGSRGYRRWLFWYAARSGSSETAARPS
ncbi:hypothetical protein J3F84DRAFT_230953 [Trichoderma pleuroticola]